MPNINDYGLPFTSQDGDRKYSALEWREYFSRLIRNGLIQNAANECQVKPQAAPNKTVYVDTGVVFINGAMRVLEEPVTLAVAENTSGNPRIDRVVARLNEASRTIEFDVLEGTPAGSPVAPDLTRTAGVYELGLADITLANGYSTITAAEIADQRWDVSLCGASSMTIGVIPPSGLDAITVQLGPETAMESGEENVDSAILDLYNRAKISNLTLFKINTKDAVSGEPQIGFNISITGVNAPLTTQYVTNSSGHLYLLLPYGSYTLKFLDSIIGFNVNDIVFSSVSGQYYKDVPAIFTRQATKRYVIDISKTYKKASYIKNLDAFLVGGGGSGGHCGSSSTWYGGGGGGGYTLTLLNQDVSNLSEFPVIIGSGGAGYSVSGGATSFLGHTVNGGSAGTSTGNPVGNGNGGSGGGGVGQPGGKGGSDGSGGSTGTVSGGGTGQGTTTREFGEPSGALYSGGGGGGRSGLGGDGGGGSAGIGGTSGNPATFYGGGGGGASGASGFSSNGASGFKGCVVVRWV